MGGSSGKQRSDLWRPAVAISGALAVLLVGCSSSGTHDTLDATASSTTSPATSPSSTAGSTTSSLGAGSLAGTWTAVRTFIPVACAIADAGPTGSCPPPTRKGWDEVRVLSFDSGATATLRFSDTNGSITTTCTGQAETTPAGLTVSDMTCQGPDKVDITFYEAPAATKRSGGCLSFPDDAKFELHPGACG